MIFGKSVQWCFLLNSARDLRNQNGIEILEKFKTSIWFSVPSYLIFCMKMKSLKKDRLKNIRMFIFGGEGFPKFQLKKLYTEFDCNVRFVNVYGPTETTCICSSYEVTEEDFLGDMDKLCPLGKLNKNYEFKIEDCILV